MKCIINAMYGTLRKLHHYKTPPAMRKGFHRMSSICYGLPYSHWVLVLVVTSHLSITKGNIGHFTGPAQQTLAS